MIAAHISEICFFKRIKSHNTHTTPFLFISIARLLSFTACNSICFSLTKQLASGVSILSLTVSINFGFIVIIYYNIIQIFRTLIYCLHLSPGISSVNSLLSCHLKSSRQYSYSGIGLTLIHVLPERTLGDDTNKHFDRLTHYRQFIFIINSPLIEALYFIERNISKKHLTLAMFCRPYCIHSLPFALI